MVQFVPDAVCVEATTAFKLQQIFCVAPALILLADTVRHWHSDVVKEHLVDFMIPRHRNDGFNDNTGRCHVDKEEANSSLRLAAIICAYQAENVVGEVGVGSPDF